MRKFALLGAVMLVQGAIAWRLGASAKAFWPLLLTSVVGFAVVAPIPSVRESTAVITNPGDLRNCRNAKRKSWMKFPIRYLRTRDHLF